MGFLNSFLRGKKSGGNRYARDFSSVSRRSGERRGDRLGLSLNRGKRNERVERFRSEPVQAGDERRSRTVAEHPSETAWTPHLSQEKRAGGRFTTFVLWVVGLACGGAALLGLVLGGLQLHRLATTSDFFAIRRIEIRGIAHFKREAVLEAAGLHEGTNSLTVSIADVEAGVRNNPWVAEVAVKRRLPDAFEIRIKERSPVFWMRKDGILYYADNRGAIIAPVDAGNFLSLPTLEIMPGGDALLPRLDELARAFQSARLPVDMAGVSLFRVSAAKGFEVFIENRNLVLCIAAEDWDLNLRRLGEVLMDLARRGELKAAREVWAADGNVWVVADA